MCISSQIEQAAASFENININKNEGKKKVPHLITSSSTEKSESFPVQISPISSHSKERKFFPGPFGSPTYEYSAREISTQSLSGENHFRLKYFKSNLESIIWVLCGKFLLIYSTDNIISNR